MPDYAPGCALAVFVTLLIRPVDNSYRRDYLKYDANYC